jgi:hypothetical protein
VRSGDFLRVPFFLRKNGHESIDSLYTLREFALGAKRGSPPGGLAQYLEHRPHPARPFSGNA